MAKLQFGNSSCQIEGTYVPVADMNLAAGDGVYFAHHVLLWKDPQVEYHHHVAQGRVEADVRGHAVDHDAGAGSRAYRIFERRSRRVGRAAAAARPDDRRARTSVSGGDRNVQYDWFQTNIWLQTGSGNDTETHYPIGMFMDKFFAPQTPGLLLLHAAGNVFVRDLAPGQTS